MQFYSMRPEMALGHYDSADRTWVVFHSYVFVLKRAE